MALYVGYDLEPTFCDLMYGGNSVVACLIGWLKEYVNS